MGKTLVDDARQWLGWLMGDSRPPGRGPRRALVPMLVVAVLALSGIAVAASTTAGSTGTDARSVQAGPPTPPAGSLDPIVAPSSDSSASSDAATPPTLPPVPTPAHAGRTSGSRTTKGAGGRSARVGRHGGAASTTTTTVPTTTTTTAPQPGGWG